MTDHTSELDLAMAMVLPHHDAEGVHFASAAGGAHTAEVWAGAAGFKATATTCEEAFAAAMTGLMAARGGAL
jgi:hypothetical protein